MTNEAGNAMALRPRPEDAVCDPPGSPDGGLLFESLARHAAAVAA